MRAGDGGEVVVKVSAQSPTFVTVNVTCGVFVMGQLTATQEEVANEEARAVVLAMVDRGLKQLLGGGS